MEVETHLFVEAKSDPRGHAIHINMITACIPFKAFPEALRHWSTEWPLLGGKAPSAVRFMPFMCPPSHLHRF